MAVSLPSYNVYAIGCCKKFIKKEYGIPSSQIQTHFAQNSVRRFKSFSPNLNGMDASLNHSNAISLNLSANYYFDTRNVYAPSLFTKRKCSNLSNSSFAPISKFNTDSNLTPSSHFYKNSSAIDSSFTRAVKSSPESDSEPSESQSQTQSQSLESEYQFTAFTPIRWAIISILIFGAGKAIYNFVQNVLFHPKFVMYLSWFFVLWPWPTAISLGLFAIKIALKQKTKMATQSDQFILLATAILWLILVPLAHFQGYVDGWPIFLSIFYFLFFSASAFIRYQLYGDLAPKEKDEQWKLPVNKFAQIAFTLAIVGSHWYAAKEALFMERTVALSNNIARVLLFFAFWLHYTSFAYLGKYFDRLVTPKAVVMFGPYRIVRHPIYTSYMLLFAGYCVALRSYVSLLIMITACLSYYHLRTELEEDILAKNFSNIYPDYKKKVNKKFIPFLI